MPESCFPDAETAVTQPLCRRVSFAEDVDTLNTEDVVADQPTTDPAGGGGNGGGYSDVGGGRIWRYSPESERPLPPGFPPFVFPEDDGGDRHGRNWCAFRGICDRDIQYRSR